jgi:hypothetical protein
MARPENAESPDTRITREYFRMRFWEGLSIHLSILLETFRNIGREILCKPSVKDYLLTFLLFFRLLS